MVQCLFYYKKFEVPPRFGYSGRAAAGEYPLTPRSTNVIDQSEKHSIKDFIKKQEEHCKSLLTPGSKETTYWFILDKEKIPNDFSSTFLKLLSENLEQTLQTIDQDRMPWVHRLKLNP